MINKKRMILRILFYIGLIIIVFPTVFVFYWMVLSSFKNQVQNLSYPPLFIFKPTLENYTAVFKQQNFGKYLFNSFVVATGSTFISLLVGIPAAYSISRFKMKRTIFILTVARMIPFISYLIPWYILFTKLKLVDTYLGLTLSHIIINLPLVIILMSSFFDDVPVELEEAATVDGASAFRTFLEISVPIAANGIITSAILSYIFSWNQFLFSLILSGPKTKTVPIAVFNFMSYEMINWGGIMAAATLIALPVLILTLFIHRYIVKGLTMGALKE